MSPTQEQIDAAIAQLEASGSRPDPQQPRLTLDDILDIASQIARDPSAGADRFRAMKMVADSQVATASLPRLGSDQDIVDRLARLMKGSGIRLTQLAYVRAFPSSRYAGMSGGPSTYVSARPELVERAKKITSLKVLNRNFPEYKVNGVPKGFPTGRSVEAKVKWCQEQALKILVEREQRDRQAGHDSMKGTDASIRDSLGGETYEQAFETITTEDKDVPGDPQEVQEP